MAIKRYIANSDNTITNAFEPNLTTRGTGSNMGKSDILETFSIFAQASSASVENQRLLVQFPISNISDDRTNNVIPASGSVNFYLKMSNAAHGQQTPSDFELIVSAVSKSWQEGDGLDLDDYSDLTYDGIGSNWVNANYTNGTVTTWTTEGGDYFTDASSSFTASFVLGTEDMEVDITELVEQWINSSGNVLGSKTNYGVGIRLNDAYEGSSSLNPDGATKSYFTKKFFSRHSEFYFKRPHIEARWNSVRQDDRGSFYFSSSLAPSYDNLNTIYLYNYVRGTLRNIPGVDTGFIYVQIHSGTWDNQGPSGQPLTLVGDGTHVQAANPTFITGGYVETGIYSASFALTGTSDLTNIFDVWQSGDTQYFSGAIDTNVQASKGYTTGIRYVLSMPNLQKQYYSQETAKLRLFVRQKNWSPNIYNVANNAVPAHLIPSASYRVLRVVDNLEVISYGTGSLVHTGLSYDVSGNYFHLDMGLFEPGYLYKLQYSFKDENTSTYYEQPYSFKFRVIE
tara:strand:+ start:11544 stop:13073 length:1530 start_codon:yes stop_codon:yes gene_type:complete